MDFRIPDETLERIASDASFSGGFAAAVVKRYRQTLQILDAAPSESALANFRCLNYRKLRGRGCRRKLALTEDVDLIVGIHGRKSKPTVVVEEIRRNGRKKK